MTEPNMRYVPTWKIVLAFILDLITVVLLAGYIIALLTGGLIEGGFHLSGFSLLLLCAVVVGYFLFSGRLFGGTFWQRILKARRNPNIDV